MNEYIAQVITRTEHELMTKSLIPVSEEEGYVKTDQPGQAAKQIGKLFKSVGNALTSLGERMSRPQDISCDQPLSDHG